MNVGMLRTRWAAVGAAVAVTLGAGSIGISYATSPSDAVAFVPITPCRILDTRPGAENVGNRNTPIGSGETHTITAHGDNGDCMGIPNTATGLSLNVTALGATTGTFLTIWATGATQPTASNLNPQPGQPPIPNAVTTGLSGAGAFDIFNGFGAVDVIIDINGYYTDHSHQVLTVLGYNQSNTEASPASTFELLRSVGDFEKVSEDSILRLDWSGHHQMTGAGFCHYQLRVDGRANDGDNAVNYQPDQEGNAVSYAPAESLATFAIFDGIAAGTHTVQIWVRGSADSCQINNGNFNQQVLVTEFNAAAGSSFASLAATATSSAESGGT